MKRISLIIIVFWAVLSIASAQELTVKEMKATNDISASQYRVNDLNEQACALVRVQLATSGATFAGNVIGTPQFKEGEYWVYVTAGTKELEVKHKSFVPCHVTFSDYGIQPLQGLTTYVLTLLMPQGAAAPVQTQKLTINYSPKGATVLIDSKFYKGNGRIEAVLPVGSHEYIIAAEGFVTAEGTVKLTADGSRTINETLTAISTAQQSASVQQQAVVQQPVQQYAQQQAQQHNTSAVSYNTTVANNTVVNGDDLSKKPFYPRAYRFKKKEIFDKNSALTNEGKIELGKLAVVLQENPQTRLTIKYAVGKVKSAYKLAYYADQARESRYNSIKDFFVGLGISQDRITNGGVITDSAFEAILSIQ